MNRLLSGVAIAALLAMAAPSWAQSGGTQAPGAAMPPPSQSTAAPTGRGFGPKASGGNYVPPSSSQASSSSAMPPMKRPARHHAMRHGPTSTTDTTAQLNRAELARLQAGAPPAPPPPPAAPPPQLQGGNSMGMPGPATGGPGLTPYSTGTQPR